MAANLVKTRKLNMESQTPDIRKSILSNFDLVEKNYFPMFILSTQFYLNKNEKTPRTFKFRGPCQTLTFLMKNSIIDI